GARGSGPRDGARGTARVARDGRSEHRAARPRAARGGARAVEEGGGGARGGRASGRATTRRRSRVDGRPRGHHRGARAATDPPGGVPGGDRVRWGGGEAARVPRAGAAARGEYHRVEGQRRRDNANRDRHERRAREVARAARQPGVTPSPRVFVLAAPSGGGKTTIARELRTRAPDSFE